MSSFTWILKQSGGNRPVYQFQEEALWFFVARAVPWKPRIMQKRQRVDLTLSPGFLSDNLGQGAVPVPELPHLGFFSRFNDVCLLSHGPIQKTQLQPKKAKARSVHREHHLSVSTLNSLAYHRHRIQYFFMTPNDGKTAIVGSGYVSVMKCSELNQVKEVPAAASLLLRD